MPVGYLPTTPTRQTTASLPTTTTAARPATTPRAGSSNPLTSATSYSNPQLPAAFQTPAPQAPIQNPGNNMTNPGYDEQAFLYTQQQLLNDPYADMMAQWAQQAGQPTGAENFMNSNLGNLQGPGQGTQYWNQVNGQYMDPFAGEQFTRQATQNFSPTGPAGAFYDQAMGQYDNFTGYTGPQNTQGQYGANAAYGPLAGQQFYNQVAGSYGDMGRYTDPNLAAGQYGATQASFGALPTPDSADPYYDRAIQLGTQSYNQGAASRGVYGSSEALSGVGNIITDLNAKRAQTAFGNEMAIAQENRARQQLLGEQARMGDLSSLAAFGANLSGLETYGNLALGAGNQTLGQQTMLGNQANMADTQAYNAQQANLQGLNTYGGLAANADTSEVNRYNASTAAMNQADQMQAQRMREGADMAFRSDDAERADYSASMGAAANTAAAANNRLNTASGIASQGSANNLGYLNAFNQHAGGAEASRQNREESQMNHIESMSRDMVNMLSASQRAALAADDAALEDYINTTLIPQLTRQGMSDADAREAAEMFRTGIKGVGETVDRATED